MIVYLAFCLTFRFIFTRHQLSLQPQATAHRVIIPDETAARQDRYSIAFFVDPDVDQLIEVDDKFKRESASHNFIYEPITSQDFLRMKLQDLASGGAKK